MNKEPLVIERTFDAPIDLVWKALTDKEQMKKWYFNVSDFRPEVGFEFEFEGSNEQKTFVHLCKITQLIPERKLAYSWVYEGYEGYSEVTFELFPEGDKTRLRLTHTGLETFPPTGDFLRKNFEAGWTAITGTMLKNFLEGQPK